MCPENILLATADGGTRVKVIDLLYGVDRAIGSIVGTIDFQLVAINLLVIALIPAIGEELTFRGVLQQALVRGTKNVHVAIILSAAIFSFIHFQFYGFLPRMFLGILLGYLFYYSGSIWTSILMHFVNNGTVVVLAYLDYKGVVDVDFEHFGSTSSIPLMILSLLLTVGIVFLSSKLKYKYGRE